MPRSGELSYKSFLPHPLPPEPALFVDSEMVQKLVKANRALVLLDTSSNLIPNAELFISMYVRKEALVSSQIEGTQCTLDDILSPLVPENANLDVGDVVNYVKAVQYALKRLETLPLCNRLLKEIHAELMNACAVRTKVPANSDARKTGLDPLAVLCAKLATFHRMSRTWKTRCATWKAT